MRGGSFPHRLGSFLVLCKVYVEPTAKYAFSPRTAYHKEIQPFRNVLPCVTNSVAVGGFYMLRLVGKRKPYQKGGSPMRIAFIVMKDRGRKSLL